MISATSFVRSIFIYNRSRRSRHVRNRKSADMLILVYCWACSRLSENIRRLNKLEAAGTSETQETIIEVKGGRRQK